MKADSVQALKQEVYEAVILPLKEKVSETGRLGVHNRRWHKNVRPRTIAIGIALKEGSETEFQLGVRIQHPQLIGTPEIGRIREMARGEVDIRYIGHTKALQGPWYQETCRPLQIGCSVGHFRVTAGSIAAFARDLQTGTTQILSSNHILANLNAAKVNDDILQPGNYDNGSDPQDAVAKFTRCVRINFQQTNVVDCAIAAVESAVAFDSSALNTFGNLAGVRTTPLAQGEPVRKVGRTTGPTTGVVKLTDVDNLEVDYSTRSATFSLQIEIQGDNGLFSDGGDSGSLIVDANNYAVGLLCSGADQPGAGEQLSYANPIATVLSALNVTLITV